MFRILRPGAQLTLGLGDLCLPQVPGEAISPLRSTKGEVLGHLALKDPGTTDFGLVFHPRYQGSIRS